MNQKPYDPIAAVYDHFQSDIEPSLWAQYVHSLTQRFGPKQGDGTGGRLLLCDLGCGTGEFCTRMLSYNYEVIGIDSSLSMLEKAREKDPAGEILYLAQDITRMELFGTVDVFTCLLDTVNHLTDKRSFSRMLASFRNYLNPGGLFIFDVATPGHLRDTLGNNTFPVVYDDYALFWQNHFSVKKQISTSDIVLFRKTDSGLFERADARIRERVYEHREILEALTENQMKVVGYFGPLSFSPPKKNDSRAFYVAQRL
jgi:SAM-dependent methyltransferase